MKAELGDKNAKIDLDYFPGCNDRLFDRGVWCLQREEDLERLFHDFHDFHGFHGWNESRRNSNCHKGDFGANKAGRTGTVQDCSKA